MYFDYEADNTNFLPQMIDTNRVIVDQKFI